MPLLAHTKPCRVSVISTGPTIRTTRVASRSTRSTTLASLSHRAAHAAAKSDGWTVESSTVRPSALDTIFDVTTTTSPSASDAAAATRAAMSSPGWISAKPSTPTTSMARDATVDP